MKKTLFIKNAALLTATSFILRLLGIVFKVWLAKTIKSEGIGLYHLVFSVNVLAVSFAAGPLPVAVTRLVSKSYTTGGEMKAVKAGVIISLLISAVTFLALFFGAPFIANTLLHDTRTIMPIKIMSISIAFVGFSAVMKGYFFAKRQVAADSLRVLLEQVIRLGVCFFVVSRFAHKGLMFSLCAVIFADTVSEIFSFLFCLFLFLKQKGTFIYKGSTKEEQKEILRIASPILASRYSTTALRTAESVITPSCLAKTMNSATALSHFGAVKGMALPVLFFPSSILSALSSLLLPEMSEAVAKGKPYVVKNAVQKTIKTTWLVGAFFGCVFYFVGGEIADIIYKDTYIGYLIKFLSPIVPLMYLDGITDGILKGLDLQSFCLKIAILDSTFRLILIAFFVPRYSMTAFLLIMTASNIFTCFATTAKLVKTTGVKLKIFKDFFAPVLFAGLFCFVFKNLFQFISGKILFCAVFCLFSFAFYVGALLLFKVVDINDYA